MKTQYPCQLSMIKDDWVEVEIENLNVVNESLVWDGIGGFKVKDWEWESEFWMELLIILDGFCGILFAFVSLLWVVLLIQSGYWLALVLASKVKLTSETYRLIVIIL